MNSADHASRRFLHDGVRLVWPTKPAINAMPVKASRCTKVSTLGPYLVMNEQLLRSSHGFASPGTLSGRTQVLLRISCLGALSISLLVVNDEVFLLLLTQPLL